MIHKICPDCKQILPSQLFYKDSSRIDKLSTYCKQCQRARILAYRNRDRARFNEINGRSLTRRRKEVYPNLDHNISEKVCSNCKNIYPISNFSRMPSSSTGFHSWCIDCARFIAYTRKLKRDYDMSYDEYIKLVEEQDNKCKICNIKTTRLVVDHDHNTGKTRGLLCGPCNSGLGMFRDSETILASALNYIIDTRSR